jgi:hypothetical protein
VTSPHSLVSITTKFSPLSATESASVRTTVVRLRIYLRLTAFSHSQYLHFLSRVLECNATLFHMFVQATLDAAIVVPSTPTAGVAHDFAMVRPDLQRPEFDGPRPRLCLESRHSLFSHLCPLRPSVPRMDGNFARHPASTASETLGSYCQVRPSLWTPARSLFRTHVVHRVPILY